MDVHYTGESVESPIGLGCEELGNYSTDIEVAIYLGNRDGTCDYDDMNNQTDIEAYKVSPKTTLLGRKRKGGRPFKQFRGKRKGPKAEMVPGK